MPHTTNTYNTTTYHNTTDTTCKGCIGNDGDFQTVHNHHENCGHRNHSDSHHKRCDNRIDLDLFKNNLHTQIMLSKLFKLFKNNTTFDKISKYYFPSCAVHYCILCKKEYSRGRIQSHWQPRYTNELSC